MKLKLLRHGRLAIFLTIFSIGMFIITPSFAEMNVSPAPENKSPVVNSVQSQVQSEINQRIDAQRKNIIVDATAAIQETQNAVKALDSNNTDEAIKALESAIGKLDLLLAREPKIQLAPLDASIVVRDLYATPETVKLTIKNVQKLIQNGHIQQARALLNTLGSDITINVINIPLSTYPSAIKAIVPLVDQGQFAQAKAQLQAAINTLVVTSHVLPLPYARTIEMLKKVENLSEVKDRTKEQNQEMEGLFQAISQQLRLAKLLGYTSNGTINLLLNEISLIEKEVHKNHSAKARIDALERNLIALLNDSLN